MEDEKLQQKTQPASACIQPNYVRATHAQDVSPLINTEISLRAPPCRPQLRKNAALPDSILSKESFWFSKQ